MTTGVNVMASSVRFCGFQNGKKRTKLILDLSEVLRRGKEGLIEGARNGPNFSDVIYNQRDILSTTKSYVSYLIHTYIDVPCRINITIECRTPLRVCVARVDALCL